MRLGVLARTRVPDAVCPECGTSSRRYLIRRKRRLLTGGQGPAVGRVSGPGDPDDADLTRPDYLTGCAARGGRALRAEEFE